MEFMILRREDDATGSRYRGTFRDGPHYVEGLGDAHEVNRAYRWFADQGGEDLVVHDLDGARKLVEVYKRLEPPQYFEIVEILRSTTRPQKDRDFLGFDLTTGHFSLLGTGLELRLVAPPGSEDKYEERFRFLRPLLRLIKEHFQPRLNAYGLFDEYDDASLCLESMMALQEYLPSLWGAKGLKFYVLGLRLVNSAKD